MVAIDRSFYVEPESGFVNVVEVNVRSWACRSMCLTPIIKLEAPFLGPLDLSSILSLRHTNKTDIDATFLAYHRGDTLYHKVDRIGADSAGRDRTGIGFEYSSACMSMERRYSLFEAYRVKRLVISVSLTLSAVPLLPKEWVLDISETRMFSAGVPLQA